MQLDLDMNWYSKGYCIIDNFLPVDTATNILNTFKTEDNWFRVDQKRLHYKSGGAFEMQSDVFPSSTEEYSQTSWRAKELEQSTIWKEIVTINFLNAIELYFNRKVVNDNTYIIKCRQKDYSRMHTDDLRGDVNRVDIGLLYYVCDQWKWDWGGLLLMGKSISDESMEAILPKHNRLIIINNQKRCPHCITPVTDYARSDRYTVASFIGCDKLI